MAYFLPRSLSRISGSGALLLACLGAACASEDSGGCADVDESYGFTEDSSFGYSMSQVLSERRDQTSELSWAQARDWLPHTASGETELVVRTIPTQGERVRELRNEDTDCVRTLSVGATVQITTADGQLEASVLGTITSYSRREFVVVADLNPSDLKGVLRIPSDVRLQLRQTIRDQSVRDGALVAYAQGESSVRSFNLATWTGSVGAEPLPTDTDTDAGVSDTDTSETDTSDTDPVVDSGATPTDAAAPTDASAPLDASTPLDAGPDAATPDAAPDATEPDAATPTPDAATPTPDAAAG